MDNFDAVDSLGDIQKLKDRHISNKKKLVEKLGNGHMENDEEYFIKLVEKKVGKGKHELIKKLVNPFVGQEETELQSDKEIIRNPVTIHLNSGEKPQKNLPELINVDSTQQQSRKNSGQVQNMDEENFNEIAEYIMRLQPFMYFEDCLYNYNKPIFKPLKDHKAITIIRAKLPERLANKLNSYQLKEILNSIKTNPHIQKEKEDIEISKNLICLKNAIYDYKRRMFLKHSPEYYFFSYVNASYDPEHVEYGYVFESYLDRLTGEDKDLKELIMQIIGYIISSSMDAKVFFILVGVPDSGKSKFGELLEGLLGVENCSHVALQELTIRFKPSTLHGKKLNLCLDLPHKSIKETGLIKQFTGGDMISAEKKYKDEFSFRNDAKLLFGCNKLPKVHCAENLEAFFRRLILIPFDYQVIPIEQDKKLVEKMLLERNYIIHKAIEAFQRLERNNFIFHPSKASDRLKRRYVADCNSVLEFVSEKCMVGNEDLRIYGLVLFDKYVEFCKGRGYSKNEIFNYTDLRDTLFNHFNIQNDRWRADGENRNGLVGITLRNQ